MAYSSTTCLLQYYNINKNLPFVAHHHSLHQGFGSVLAESLATCFGDGITTEWFETVLETSARFLASEVPYHTVYCMSKEKGERDFKKVGRKVVGKMCASS
jgi:hypothetical protein